MITKEMFELVNDCYNDVIEDINNTFNYIEPTRPHTSEIFRDYKSIAAEEWEDYSLEEVDEIFDSIYKTIDESRFLDAIAWS